MAGGVATAGSGLEVWNFSLASSLVADLGGSSATSDALGSDFGTPSFGSRPGSLLSGFCCSVVVQFLLVIVCVLGDFPVAGSVCIAYVLVLGFLHWTVVEFSGIAASFSHLHIIFLHILVSVSGASILGEFALINCSFFLDHS
ncbi:Hypothetical predicted protein [Olea europaea subsp. europaea]|uniref:Uncharacterized protein n=1 Tax=Olea europaea subsp. europaea TaxID=158383 RepID=A0A8S0S579_OLEEU|nr:Hypothetical predicted protein [Olea europaea subsp. europaea]